MHTNPSEAYERAHCSPCSEGKHFLLLFSPRGHGVVNNQLQISLSCETHRGRLCSRHDCTEQSFSLRWSSCARSMAPANAC